MKSSPVPVIVISCILILLCCLCASILVFTQLISRPVTSEIEAESRTSTPIISAKPIVIRPKESPVQVKDSTLETLENSTIPINDLLDLARRFEGKLNIPIALDPISTYLQVDAQDSFWVMNTDTEENFRINATLGYVTDHAYFWIEDGVRYKEKSLRALAETFEERIYPTNHEYFGAEWTPGVDGDPHLYIIYAEGLGRSLAGYFSPSDEYHPLAHEYSNMHELFVLNADNLDFDEEYTYGVLAHEFQHMIHWYQDRNEWGWVNEGLSELASYINGYDIGGFDYLYALDPDLQLNDWPNNPDETAPHYGASFLFMAYFLDRFGIEGIQALSNHPANGMAGVDAVLTEYGLIDPLLDTQIRADDVFLDWALATYLQDERIADGRYRYYRYDRDVHANDTESIESCPTEVETRNVHQYGVDYIGIECQGDYTLKFEGAKEVDLLPVDPFSGEHAFWSNKGDDSDMTLTKTFDFHDHDGPLTLTYWTWYDLEEDYDYVYLTVSNDGEYWQIVTTPSGTAEDLSGNNYGWGYNGISGGNGKWIQEKVDLSQFAGERVQIRFEYVTDGAVNGDGFLLDDVSIPEMGFFSDFETGESGWEAAGFVRVRNSLTQTFRLGLIENGDFLQVKYIELNPDNAIEIPLKIGGKVKNVVLVVTGTTRFTRQVANYQFQISP
jgi:immune inhibitor A